MTGTADARRKASEPEVLVERLPGIARLVMEVVPLRHLDVGMPEHLLDELDRDAAFESSLPVVCLSLWMLMSFGTTDNDSPPGGAPPNVMGPLVGFDQVAGTVAFFRQGIVWTVDSGNGAISFAFPPG